MTWVFIVNLPQQNQKGLFVEAEHKLCCQLFAGLLLACKLSLVNVAMNWQPSLNKFHVIYINIPEKDSRATNKSERKNG